MPLTTNSHDLDRRLRRVPLRGDGDGVRHAGPVLIGGKAVLVAVRIGVKVLRVFRGYGWPAIQAALDDPGDRRDPSVQWARTFPKIPRGPRFDDEVAAERRSWQALEEAVTHADRDPRAFQAVLTRLETDPHPAIRHAAAWFLLRRAGEEHGKQALQAAATEDEDIQVRWVARYAFRLAERETSTDAAGPAPG
jgi:hypothetical protein